MLTQSRISQHKDIASMEFAAGLMILREVSVGLEEELYGVSAHTEVYAWALPPRTRRIPKMVGCMGPSNPTTNRQSSSPENDHRIGTEWNWRKRENQKQIPKLEKMKSNSHLSGVRETSDVAISTHLPTVKSKQATLMTASSRPQQRQQGGPPWPSPPPPPQNPVPSI